ncbi:hypothetical protein ABW21_db0204833 [Orbilia brochopaga]|nr:hypothetical protein ABW21_db0204833 [Drechslerella brochopaga]
MSRHQRHVQSRLADPTLSYKSVRYGNTATPVRPFSTEDQSTLSQFGFTPSSLSATTSNAKKKRTLIPYGSRKRKSWPPDNWKAEGSEDRETGGSATKRRRISRTRNVIDEEEESEREVAVKVEAGREGASLKDESDQDDDESWRPPSSYAPKRRRRKTTSRSTVRSSKAKDRTLTQMYPLTRFSESEYEDDEKEQDVEDISYEGPELDVDGVDYESPRPQFEPEQVQELDQEEENIKIKNEPVSDNETSHEHDSTIRIKKEEDEPAPIYQHTEDGKENIPREDTAGPTDKPISTSSAAGIANPKTPKKLIPNVVPSSYTPPVTPLSPLRHSQLEAIYKSPSVQRLWRMKGLGMPGRAEPTLSPVAEHIKKEDDDTSSMVAPTAPHVNQPMPPRRPDFGQNSSRPTLSASGTEQKVVQALKSLKSKMVPSSQWWEREDTLSSNSARVLETVLEADSQPEVQVRSSVSVSRTGTPTPKTRRTVDLEDLDVVVPESPVLKRIADNGNKKKISPTGFKNMEPLLRDSSGLHTLATSFLRKESSTFDRVPNSIQEESQKSEVSLRSVDKQLLIESEEADKASAERESKETQHHTIDSDETLDSTPSQAPPQALERIPQLVHRTTSVMSRKDSHIPLLPPSSPPHSHSLNLRDIFPSSPVKVPTSPGSGIRKTSSDLTESLESPVYTRKGPIETHTQWKLRTFGPSQAIPTLSQILPASMLCTIHAKPTSISTMSAVSTASSFIENAPPGELTEVINDIGSLLDDLSVSDKLAPAVEKYNKEQFTTTKLPGGSALVIVSEHNDLGGGRFYDSESASSFTYNHKTQARLQASTLPIRNAYGFNATTADGLSAGSRKHRTFNPNTKSRKSLLRDVGNHVKEHFPSLPAYGVYPTDDGIAILIVGNKYSPSNYWNGRWRSTYIFNPSSSTLTGSIAVDVHYYEDGNVRLVTEKAVSESLRSTTSAEVARAIASVEKKYQEELNRAFGALSEGAFKNLRRQLPVTRQKMDWQKASAYKIGQDIGGGGRAR